MNWQEQINQIDSAVKLEHFLHELINEIKRDPNHIEWPHTVDYLDSICSVLDDDAYSDPNAVRDPSALISWKSVAKLLYVGLFYE